jgi:RNA polymerase sigma factor (sigma-70 family)
VTAASKRFLDHVAWARSIARRWYFEGEDVEQAALLGLHLADVAAAPDMPPTEFRRFASMRVQGEAMDYLRRLEHGRRIRGASSRKPRRPEPQAVGLAVDMGLTPGDVSRSPSPLDLAEESEMVATVLVKVRDLPERTRDILLRRLDGENEESIASDYGVSTARVSQIAWEAARAIAVRDPE